MKASEVNEIVRVVTDAEWQCDILSAEFGI